MKNLKKFEAYQDTLATSKEVELFCKNYLSYLMDYGISLSVRPCIKVLRDNSYYECLEFTMIPSSNHFTWVDIKDSFIPFIQILTNSYNIVSFIVFSPSDFTEPISILENELEVIEDDMKIRRINFPIEINTTKYNESHESDLRDFCMTYLSYLIDDGFALNIDEPDQRNNSIAIWLEKKGNREVVPGSGHYASIPFNWIDIKDEFLPFIVMLSKHYKMCVTHEEIEKGKSIIINTTNSDNFEFSVQDMAESESRVELWGSTISEDLCQSPINSIAILIKI